VGNRWKIGGYWFTWHKQKLQEGCLLLRLGFGTVLAPALLPLVFAQVAPAAVLALALPPLVFAEAAATAVLAMVLPLFVYAQVAPATVLAFFLKRLCHRSPCTPIVPSEIMNKLLLTKKKNSS